MKLILGPLQDFVQLRLADPSFFTGLLVLVVPGGQLHPRPLGQHHQGFAERDVLTLHHEFKTIAPRLTGPAAERLAFRIDAHRGRMVRVKGAQAQKFVSPTHRLQRHGLADQGHQVGPGAHLLLEILPLGLRRHTGNFSLQGLFRPDHPSREASRRRGPQVISTERSVWMDQTGARLSTPGNLTDMKNSLTESSGMPHYAGW